MGCGLVAVNRDDFAVSKHLLRGDFRMTTLPPALRRLITKLIEDTGMHKRRVGFVVVALATCGLQAQTAAAQPTVLRNDSRVTPVSGESWLVHLNRSLGDTSMGRTGRLGPPPIAGDNSMLPRIQLSMTSARDVVTLHGSDLYRLNCQGCHRESGLGAPPEINSVINPVRATSVPLILGRMRTAGMDMTYADAAKLAQQSKTAVLERLHKGGENMPAFTHLSDAEIRPLLAYLNQLADVPGAGNAQSAVKESSVRVGELIVKSTCHTCHSAVGRDPRPQELSDGAIPPLSTLTQRKSLPEFIRKVTQGAPVLMGTPALLCRGRMPVFYYLTEEEAAEVYLYLTIYPPSEQPEPSPIVAASLGVHPRSGNGPGLPMALFIPESAAPKKADSADSADFQTVALPWTEAVVGFILAAGLVFTFREFRRLSAESLARNRMAGNQGQHPGKPQRGTDAVTAAGYPGANFTLAK